MALIAISSGSSAWSIHFRRIKMLVSSMPCRGSSLICAVGLMVQYGILISPECFQVNRGGVARHGGELLPGDEPATLSQRDQLADPMAVPGDGEGLSVFDRVHDLPRSCPQVALGDFRMSAHRTRVAPGAIGCYRRWLVVPSCLAGPALDDRMLFP